MQHNTETIPSSAPLAQAFQFLSQLGLRGAVLFGEDVDQAGRKPAGQHTYLNATATLPEGNPVSAMLHLTQQLQASLRPSHKRSALVRTDLVKPREVMLYEGPRFGVVIGNTRLMVEVSDKPTDMHRLLAAQPVARQVAVTQTPQGALARTETQARAEQRMKAELALL